MLEAVCPNGHRLQIPPEHAGMKLRCPACNAIFQLAGVPQNPGASGLGLQNAPAGQPAAAPPPPAAANPSAAAPQVTAPAATQPHAAAEAPPARWAGSETAAAPPPAPAAASAPPAQAPAQPRVGPAAMRRVDFGGAVRIWGQIALMVGLVLVLSARGCDGLALRNIARLQANLELEKNRLADQEAKDKATFQAQLANPKEPAAIHETARKRLDELTTQFANERNALASGDMFVAARDADAENRTWAYWREMAFVAGSILLSLGLIALIMDGINVERYLAFGMLAIILFSLYIGGTAWIGSIFSSTSRAVFPGGS
jgi:hypothetical protein